MKKVRNKKMELIRLVILLIVFVVVAYFAIGRMVFPRRRSYSTLDGLVKLSVSDNVEVAMLYLSNPQAKYTVLFNHGNYEDLGTLDDFLEEYRRNGFAVLAWDYRGYGLSGGRPTEANVIADAREVFDFMTDELGIDPQRIIVHGRSVGCGPACDLASTIDCGGLIVESGFMSVFSTRLPWVGLWGDQFVNLDKIAEVKCPKLFIHGKLDRTVRFNHALRMYEKAKEPKSYLWLENAGHNDILWQAEDEFWQAIVDFSEGK